MKCPKCSDHPLTEKKLKKGALALDQCSTCKGLWFDKGELDTVLASKAANHWAMPKITIQNDAICCPRCKTGMVELCYPGTTIFIDMCKSCEGVWLDDKEWTEIGVARAERNKIICPKCKTKQDRATECNKCGVIFSKLNEKRERTQASEQKAKNEDDYSVEQESYADDIPGIKGTLLRFIDKSIASLTDY